jgi:beta-1,4-mannosyl-glycoprotein beta-1,4-N-acetylglucosaminyltransferase
MIIDCFPFFNELDLLEIRLNELYDTVDFFVLSEANLTFTARQKPFYFEQNKTRFKKFLRKIVHLKIDTYPKKALSDAWKMDHFQKQAGVDYMQKQLTPGKNDMVILSDMDEIPKASKVQRAFENKEWRRLVWQMPIFYYYMNCVCVSKAWHFARVVRPDGKIKLSSIRGKRGSDGTIRNAGWHFSYLGDIQEKLRSFPHTEYDKFPYNKKNYIKAKKTAGADLFGRDEKYKFKFLDDLSYLPQYVQDNIDRFKKYIRRNPDKG